MRSDRGTARDTRVLRHRQFEWLKFVRYNRFPLPDRRSWVGHAPGGLALRLSALGYARIRAGQRMQRTPDARGTQGSAHAGAQRR